MNKLARRNKILFQSQENIWNNSKIFSSNKKKWKFFIKNAKNVQNKERPRNLKDLFKRKLIAKQKFKSFYGAISNYQLKNIFSMFKNQGQAPSKVILFLEQRLDMILYRIGISSSIFQIKQKIVQQGVRVNGQVVKSPNYRLKEGDIILLKDYQTNYKYIPTYLEYNEKLKTIIVLRKPRLKEIHHPFSLELDLVSQSFL